MTTDAFLRAAFPLREWFAQGLTNRRWRRRVAAVEQRDLGVDESFLYEIYMRDVSQSIVLFCAISPNIILIGLAGGVLLYMCGRSIIQKG